MSLVLERLRSRKLGVFVSVFVLAVIAGVAAYLLMFNAPQPGKLLADEMDRLETLVEQDPGNPGIRVGLALVYAETGSHREAIAQLQTVLELDGSHQGALVTLGDIYMELGRNEEAIESYSKVVELNEDNPMRGLNKQLQGVYYYLGTAYLNLEKHEDAIQSLEEALAIDKTDADAWYILGATYQHMGGFEKAINSFEESIRFVPNFKEAYQGLAQCYEQIGQTSLAAYADAMVSYSSGSSDEAIGQLEAVIANTDEFAEIYVGLGLAYERTGETEQAINAYQKALALDPHLWMPRARLQTLGAAQE